MFFDFDNSGEVHETLAKSRVFADLVASMKTRFLTQHTQKQVIKQRILLKSRFYFFSVKHTKQSQNQWFSRIGSHSQNEDFTKNFKKYYKKLDFTEIVILKIMVKCRKH